MDLNKLRSYSRTWEKFKKYMAETNNNVDENSAFALGDNRLHIGYFLGFMDLMNETCGDFVDYDDELDENPDTPMIEYFVAGVYILFPKYEEVLTAVNTLGSLDLE